MTTFEEIISIAGYAIEAVGVLVIILGSVIASLRFVTGFRQQPEGVAYRVFRRQHSG